MGKQEVDTGGLSTSQVLIFVGGVAIGSAVAFGAAYGLTQCYIASLDKHREKRCVCVCVCVCVLPPDPLQGERPCVGCALRAVPLTCSGVSHLMPPCCK